MKKIVPCLWFDGNAEDAVAFYKKIFKNSKTLKTSYYTKAGPGPEGSVLTIQFSLDGQEFLALNGGPHYKFTPAISFSVNCKDQKEIDVLWAKLSKGGAPGQCGWLTDKFGVSWQIVPKNIVALITNPAKAERVMKALFGMTKLDVKALEQA